MLHCVKDLLAAAQTKKDPVYAWKALRLATRECLLAERHLILIKQGRATSSCSTYRCACCCADQEGSCVRLKGAAAGDAGLFVGHSAGHLND